MDLASPINSVIPSAHGVVLSVLARTDASLSGRRVAALAAGRVSQRQANEVLRELTEAGVVTCEVQPPAKLYRLNRQHLAAKAIEDLAGLRERLLLRMRDDVERWRVPATAVWLFGSAARGDGGPGSDIDVLVLRADSVDADNSEWREQLDVLAENITTWTGNACEVLEYSEADLAGLVQSGERLVSELRRDAIQVSGDAVDQRTLLRLHDGRSRRSSSSHT